MPAQAQVKGAESVCKRERKKEREREKKRKREEEEEERRHMTPAPSHLHFLHVTFAADALALFSLHASHCGMPSASTKPWDRRRRERKQR